MRERSLDEQRAGGIVAGPDIASRGVVYVKENETLLDEIREVAVRALAGGDSGIPWDRETAVARVRTAVRQFVNQRYHRKPVVLPIILEA